MTIKTNETRLIPFLWTGGQDDVSYTISLEADGASIQFIGLILGSKKDNLHATINVTHKGRQTTSNVILHGVLTDTAAVNIDGLVTINKGAKQSQARLDAHILLMSHQAKGRVVPSLEILENDVKAGHAATVGKIDARQVFYLQSRGLTEDQAKKLIIEGFLMSTIEKFPEELAKKAKAAVSGLFVILSDERRI